MHINETIYKKLQAVLGDLDKLPVSLKLKSGGFMDLNMDNLYQEEGGGLVIALSHYYKQNGDMIADPDMEIRIYNDMKMAEALTYQDTYRYDEVYPQPGQVNVTLKLRLNQFLRQWLNNLQMQGFMNDQQEVLFNG